MISASLLGWLTGRLIASRPDHRSHQPWVILIICLALAWIATSWLSRFYADSYQVGWTWAAGYAHTGRFISLMALISFGFSYALNAEADRLSGFHQAAGWFVFFFSLGWLAYQSLPAWIFLSDGKRDENGFLRQTREQEYTCVPVSLVNYLEQYRQRPQISERDAARACGTTRGGTPIQGLLRGCQHYGLNEVRTEFISFDELIEGPMPAVICLSTVPGMRHATLMTGVRSNRVAFIDPAYGHWTMPIALVEKGWYGPAIYFE
jgi:hypothetical protein